MFHGQENAGEERATNDKVDLEALGLNSKAVFPLLPEGHASWIN